MRVLVTRPLDDALEIAERLKERGHETIVAPLLDLQFHDGAEIELGGVQAILATSANGIRALARRTARRDTQIFAVGPQTARAARDAGFANVRNAEGDAVALAVATGGWASPSKGVLLHATGADGEGRFAQLLRDRGFTLRSEILYAVKAVERLPAEAEAALAVGAVDAALFFSPRSARVFKDCMLNAAADLPALTAVCISEATAAALAPLDFGQVRVASHPNQDALLACLD